MSRRPEEGSCPARLTPNSVCLSIGSGGATRTPGPRRSVSSVQSSQVRSTWLRSRSRDVDRDHVKEETGRMPQPGWSTGCNSWDGFNTAVSASTGIDGASTRRMPGSPNRRCGGVPGSKLTANLAPPLSKSSNGFALRSSQSKRGRTRHARVSSAEHSTYSEMNTLLNIRPAPRRLGGRGNRPGVPEPKRPYQELPIEILDMFGA